MKKIGILLRENNDKYYVNKELINYISSYDINIIGIVINNNDDFNKVINIIDICDGVILPGGNNERDIDIKLCRYLYDINKPTLGICLGMQNMAKSICGDIKKLDTNFHNSDLKYVHKIIIKKDTLLYKIIGSNKILVNSTHNYNVVNTKLNVSAYSEDFVIEAVEDVNKKFYLGVQWHPERLLDDINSALIIDEFINNI